ncbi:MAG: TldD/PmbA family protein [Chloroflexi bacterium]|nr:TldD/PmbA family protein [Chloroflexota bacterium]
MQVAEAAEVYWVSFQETPVSFEANRLKYLTTRQSSGVALRVIVNGRIGHSATNHREDMAALVSRAVEVAQFGPEAHFELPGPQTYPSVEAYDPQTEAFPVDAMVELGQGLIDGVRAHAPDLQCEAGVAKETLTLHIINSRGSQAEYHKSVFSASLWGTLVQDTDMLFVGDGETLCQPMTDGLVIIERVLRQLELAQRTATVSSGALPVIFTPRGVRSALVAPLYAAFSGRVVLQGASPLGGRLGETVFSPHLTLWDDPTLPLSPGGRPFDDEGIPTQRTPLVAAGAVANFLYDLQTAGLAGTRSTGSARRSLGGLPSPSVSTLIVDEGEATFPDMVADMKEGLVIEDLMGASQGNVLGGDFGGNVLLGYKVEAGTIVGRVKDTMVAGNVYKVLSSLRGIGQEARWVGGHLRTPALYGDSISVSTKS